MNQEWGKKFIKETIKEFRQEELKLKKRMIFHNTELLMKHYNELKQHSENAIYKLEQIFGGENIADILNYEETIGFDKIYIDSIVKTKIRTTIMVQHVDIALDMLKESSDKEGYSNKYNMLIDLYINNKTYEELAKIYYCDTTTLRRWKNLMLGKLSILLFGTEGLLLQSRTVK